MPTKPYWSAKVLASALDPVAELIAANGVGRWSELMLSSFLEPDWRHDVMMPASATTIGSWVTGGSPSALLIDALNAEVTRDSVAYALAVDEPRDHISLFFRLDVGRWHLAVA